MNVGVESSVGSRCGVIRPQRFQYRQRIDTGQFRSEFLERVSSFLGNPRNAVFASQQMVDFRIENLPREQTRLLHHLVPVSGIGVAMEISSLVEKPFTARV